MKKNKKYDELLKWCLGSIQAGGGDVFKYRTFNNYTDIFLSTIELEHQLYLSLSIPAVVSSNKHLVLSGNIKKDSENVVNKVMHMLNMVFTGFNDSIFDYYLPIFKEYKNNWTSYNKKERKKVNIKTFESDYNFFRKYYFNNNLTGELDFLTPIDTLVLYARIQSSVRDEVICNYVSVICPPDPDEINIIRDVGAFRDTITQDNDFGVWGYKQMLENSAEIRGSTIYIGNNFFNNAWMYLMQVKMNLENIYNLKNKRKEIFAI
jgi:hypothetical protein